MKDISGKLLDSGARLAVAALLSSSVYVARADIAEREYIDLSKWDVGDYVQDGLVIHYDGIRNISATTPHSTDTARWNNLVEAYPNFYMDWVSYTGAESNLTRKKGNTTQGAWNNSNGFVFNGRVCWMKWNNDDGKSPVKIPSKYTMQFAVTANAADHKSGSLQIGYLFTPHSDYDWGKGGVAIRSSSNGTITPENAVYAVDSDRLGSANIRPNFSNAKPSYATVLADDSALRVFEGTKLPEEDDSGYAKITGTAPTRENNWIALGGLGKKSTTTMGDFQGFHGTLHSYRLYSRALNEKDLEKNRIVDDARFFGKRHPIAVTNVVIASTYSFLDGKEPAGFYQVDGSHTFTATQTEVTTTNDFTYKCTGYLLESWSDATESWGDPVLHEGEFYVEISASDRKRVTWLWKATRAAHTAADYTLADYSPAGLVLNYDGIHNDGADKKQNPDATKWKNLAQGWEDQDMYWVSYIENENTAGEYSADRWKHTEGAWNGENGYVFDGKECFMKWNEGRKFILPPAYTWQFALDAKTADQSDSNGGISYLFLPHAGNDYGSWQSGSVQMRATALDAAGIPANSIVLTDETRYGGTNIRPCFSDSSPRFATVLADSKAARVFGGVEIPTSEPGYKKGAMATTRTNNWFVIGGQYNPYSGKTLANFQGFRGTMHSVRFYDRPLTEEELERNREADSARFFKELATTNVVVSINGVEKAYKVEGEWTFTPPDTATDVVGYRLFVLQDNGDWEKLQPFQSGDKFDYSETDFGGKTIKLEWAPEPPGMMIIVR